MQNTPNYGLKKPAQSDFYNVDDFNANADIMDTEIANVNTDISNLGTNKLDKTGDASNVTNTFTQASTRANLVSGENQSTTFGKLMKWFVDLKPVAWSGNASDLTEDASNRLVTDSEKTTWNGKASTDVATSSSNGLMSSTDKTKLDGVATNANNYVHPSTHPPSVIVQDASNRFVTDTEKTTWNGKLDIAGGTITGDLMVEGELVTKSVVTRVQLGSGSTNIETIPLEESIFNFSRLYVRVEMGGTVRIHHTILVRSSELILASTIPYTNETDNGLYLSTFVMVASQDGMTLNRKTASSGHVSFCCIRTGSYPSLSFSECSVLEVFGVGRIYPTGTEHNTRLIDGKLHRVTTLPNGEEEISLLPEGSEDIFLCGRSGRNG